MKSFKFQSVKFRNLFFILKLLPAVRFALMLGNGIIASCMAAWLIYLIGVSNLPATAADARVHGLTIGLCFALGVIGINGVTLAFGKLDKINITTPNGIGVNVEFDKDDDLVATPDLTTPSAVTTVTTTEVKT